MVRSISVFFSHIPYLSCHCTQIDDAFKYFRALLNLILKESSNNVKFNYFCKYCKTNPSKGGDVVQTDEGIVQFYLDPVVKKPITRGKGAGVNVQAKSLTMYFADMTFCNYPQLLLIFPERQTQVETMGKKST